MDRKTLTGFILIGAILLLWPSYLELISPSEKSEEDVVAPDTSLVEKYSEQTLDDPVKISVIDLAPAAGLSLDETGHQKLVLAGVLPGVPVGHCAG